MFRSKLHRRFSPPHLSTVRSSPLKRRSKAPRNRGTVGTSGDDQAPRLTPEFGISRPDEVRIEARVWFGAGKAGAVSAIALLVPALLVAQPARAGEAIAFVDVNVLTMETEQEIPHATVLVTDGKIAAIGPVDQIAVPEGARKVIGSGRWLIPGLCDAHVHLDLFGRPDFGDAPLYLAAGVTTVLNLHGDQGVLAIREQIRRGQRMAPNLYTSGEFVDEPRVRTPQEAAAEASKQRSAGYDVLKIHELRETTSGLSPETYSRLMESARASGLVVVGHAIDRIGLERSLRERQNFAHIGELLNLYALPRGLMREMGGYAFVVLALFVLSLVFAGVLAVARRRRSTAPPRGRERVALIAVAAGPPILVAFWFRHFFDGETAMLWLGESLTALFAAAVGWLCLEFARRWRRIDRLERFARAWLCVSAATLCVLFGTVGVVSWRSTSSGLAGLSKDVADAKVSVLSTLVVYQTLSAMERHDRAVLGRDGRLDDIDPHLAAEWERLGAPMPQWASGLLERFRALCMRTAAALVTAGVPVVAGTDTGGFPYLVPGRSLHDEVELIARSGAGNFAALRAATFNVAQLLGKESEFGTIAVGQRADLVLLDDDPLRDLGSIRHPRAVVVRGQWVDLSSLRRIGTSRR